MRLQDYIDRGFPTSGLCNDGDAEGQDAKWLASKQQSFLLTTMRELRDAVAKIADDPHLNDAGRAAKRREAGNAALARLTSEAGQRIPNTIRSKVGMIRDQLARASRPPEETDIGRLERLLRVQGVQRFYEQMDGSGLLQEIARAIRERDAVAFVAVTELPAFFLRGKGVTREAVDAARRDWLHQINPTLAQAAEDASVMENLCQQNTVETERAIREFCAIEPPREVRITK